MMNILDRHKDFLLQVALLAATVLFGAGLFVASNYPTQYRAAAASVPLADRDYRVSLPLAPDLWRDPLSLDETLRIVGGWGCRLRTGMPFSMLHYTQCF